MNKLFVYGSLRSGCYNNPLLIRNDAKLLYPTHTRSPLFDLVSFGTFPAMILGRNKVTGEVWEVSNDLLAILDRLEGHPRWYRRTEITVVNPFDESGVVVEAYIMPGAIEKYSEKTIDPVNGFVTWKQ